MSSIKSDFIVEYKESFIDSETKSLCLVMDFAENGDALGLVKKYRGENTEIPEEIIWNIAI